MQRLSVAQLADDLRKAADAFRGKMDPSTWLEIISGILLLKWASDQVGHLQIPDRSRWTYIVEHARATLGTSLDNVLNDALNQLVWSNRDLRGILDGLDFSRRASHSDLQRLVLHFDRISLNKNNLEFNDTVGRAYDLALGLFAESAGKRGGVFYTPRSVVDLMVRLVRPGDGQSIYDPFTGSGGMLLRASEYVSEHAGESSHLALFGQEMNRLTWSLARLNLLFHGIMDASILRGNTLTDPGHVIVDGVRKHFDRVLTNPPFSVNYSDQDLEFIKFPERMRYGWSNRADLMNVQHVLSMLSVDGLGAVVAPHGALFRSGTETEIRRGVINDGRLAAVIGIGPNVFHGTAIPACILVLTGMTGLPGGQRGTVLFINAEHEVITGRSQNYIEPRHVEKIVDVFREWRTLAGFSRVVTVDEIEANDFNLNIRRYVKVGRPVEATLDPRATLLGGVPRDEIDARSQQFQAFNIDPIQLFEPRDPKYLDFLPEGYDTTAARISELAAPGERAFIDHFRNWWQQATLEVTKLASTNKLLTSRSRIMIWFYESLLPEKILDRYQLIGVFADWWADHHDDLRGLDGGHIPDSVAASLGEDLGSRVARLIAMERQTLVNAYRSWGERYAVSLLDLEKQREAAASRLNSHLARLGYPLPDVPH